MQYIYIDDNGNEVGPVALDHILQAIGKGEIHKDTPVRNNIMKSFSPASEHQAFRKALLDTNRMSARRKGETVYEYNRRIDASFSGGMEKSHAFVRDVKIVDGTVAKRLLAALTDWFVLLTVLAVMLVFTLSNQFSTPEQLFKSNELGEWERVDATTTPHGTIFSFGQIESGGVKQQYRISRDRRVIEVWNHKAKTLAIYDLNKVLVAMTVTAAIWAAAVVVYFVFLLGYFAQTIGMWFWGLVLVKEMSDTDVDYQITYSRAAQYTLAMFLFGWMLPISCLLTKRRGVHCLMTRSRVADISAGSTG